MREKYYHIDFHDFDDSCYEAMEFWQIYKSKDTAISAMRRLAEEIKKTYEEDDYYKGDVFNILERHIPAYRSLDPDDNSIISRFSLEIERIRPDNKRRMIMCELELDEYELAD